MAKTPALLYSLEKTLMLRKTEGKRIRWQRVRGLDGITDSVGREMVRGSTRSMGSQRSA